MDEDKPGAAPEDPLGVPEPHDVLAAEEFGIGTRDDRYPADPTGIPGPHDVLAAEEFAMPSPGDIAPAGDGVRFHALVPLLLLAFAAGVAFARRRARR